MNRWQLFIDGERGAVSAAPAAGSASARGAMGSNSGSPDGTRAIPGDVLPAPELRFGGTINLNAGQSKPMWPPRAVPPPGGANILLILTVDVGFGA